MSGGGGYVRSRLVIGRVASLAAEVTLCIFDPQ